MLATHNPPTVRSWVIDLLLMVFLLGGVYLLWLGSHALFTPDEGRYSEVAREMIMTGDYITPRLDGVVFLDKPILYYWLQAIAIKLFGLKEWALRFWPACIAVLGCLVTYVAGRLLFSRRTGIIAAVILAANPLYYGAAHYANLDLEVAVFISNTLFFSLLSFQATSNRQRTIFILLAYLFCGLATLTKGLIGLAFPLMIIGLWILSLQRWNTLRKMHLLSGACIFIAITVPWYVLAQRANPQFFHFFFVVQQFERFLTKASFNNSTTAWFYVPVVLAGFLPWSVFLFQALMNQIKSVWQGRKQHQTELFLLLWTVIVFSFFSFPKSKTVGYILPLFPALSLIVGQYLSERWDKPKSQGIQAAVFIFVILCFFILGACLIVPHIKAIEIAHGLIPYLNATAILFLFGGIAIFYLFYKNNLAYLFSAFTAIAITFLLILLASAAAMNEKTIKPLAMSLKPIITTQDEIVTFYRYYQDLPLYLERHVTIVADWHASDIVQNDNWVRELWFGMPFQNTSAWLIEEPAFWKRWNSGKRLFVFMNVHDYADFSKKTRTAYKWGEYNDVALVGNTPFIHRVLSS